MPPRLKLESLRRFVPVFVPRIDIAAGLLDHVIEPAVAVEVAHTDFLRGHVCRGQRDTQIRRLASLQRQRTHCLRCAREAGRRLDRVTRRGIEPVRVQQVCGLRERHRVEFDTVAVLQAEDVKRDLGIILAQQAPAHVDALRHLDRQRAAAHGLYRTRFCPAVNLGPPDDGRHRFGHDLHVIHPAVRASAAHDAHIDRVDPFRHREPRLAALPPGAARLGSAADRPTDQLLTLVAHHLNRAGTRVAVTLHPAGDRIRLAGLDRRAAAVGGTPIPLARVDDPERARAVVPIIRQFHTAGPALARPPTPFRRLSLIVQRLEPGIHDQFRRPRVQTRQNRAHPHRTEHLHWNPRFHSALLRIETPLTRDRGSISHTSLTDKSVMDTKRVSRVPRAFQTHSRGARG